MKIGQKPELPGALAQTGRAKQAKSPAPAAEGVAKGAAAASGPRVPVTLSGSARALEQPGRTSSEFDAKRVSEVRAAIGNGTFKVNAEVIADKMLSGAQEIFSRSRG